MRGPYQMKRTTESRFWEKVEPVTESGCWIWTGALSDGGYGRFGIRRKTIPAHRYAYELLIGRVPEGLQIDHKCRVRCCVNPWHLEPVTQQENIRRGEAGKRPPYCPKGHLYDEWNTLIHTNGGRRCRQCVIEAGRVARRAKPGFGAPHRNSLKTHCPKGHAYDGKYKTGSRRCLQCHREKQKARYHERGSL